MPRTKKSAINLMKAFMFFNDWVTGLWEDVRELGCDDEYAIYNFFTDVKKRKEIAKMIVERFLKIDRSKPFNPESFIGGDWSIEEQDERSLTLTEVDLSKVVFETTLGKNENRVKGEEKLKRLKEKNVIRLDAKIFQTLWENQNLIPEGWKEKTNGSPTFIFFDGTILRNSNGLRCVLDLCWRDGEWYWYYSWLGRGWHADDPSAVLAS